MPRAYSYLRFSTPEQANGDSLRRQLELSKAYCLKNGLDLDETLTDPGVSAYRGQNAATGRLAAFLYAVKKGRVPKGSYLLVESFDRLSRQEIESAFTQFLNLIQAEVVIVTLNDEMVYRKGELSMTQLIISLTIMSRAHEESKTKSLRLLAAWNAKRKGASERRITSMCPKWLKPVGNKFEAIPERVEVVLRIFEMKRQGQGKYVICSTFNKEGVPVWNGVSRDARHWHHSYIERILTSRAVLGEFQAFRVVDGKKLPNGDPVKGYFPAVVSEELFLAVQGQRTRLGGRNSPKCKNLVSKMAFCGECGSSVYLSDKGDYQYLVCSKAVSGSGCRYESWSYKSFEKLLLEWAGQGSLRALLAEPDDTRLKSLQHQADVTAGKLDEAKGRSARLLQLVEEGSGSLPEMVRRRLDDYEIQIRETSILLERLKGQIADEQASLDSAHMDAAEIQSLAKSISTGKAGIETRQKLKSELGRRIEKVTVYLGGLPHQSQIRANVQSFIAYSNSNVGTEDDGPPVSLAILDRRAFVASLRNQTKRTVIEPGKGMPTLVLPIGEEKIYEIDHETSAPSGGSFAENANVGEPSQS